MVKWAKHIFLCIFLLFSLLSKLSYQDTATRRCIQESPCLCRFDKHSKIDLSKTMKNENSKFLQDTRNNVTFYFHGCTDGIFNATEGNQTKPITTSLIMKFKDVLHDLGSSKNLKFDTDQDDTILVFKNESGHVLASIRLICSITTYNHPILSVLETDSQSNHALSLISPEACIITEHAKASSGSIFLTLLIFGSLIYLFGGGLLMYFIRGARGYEIIPNVDFWRELPGLVKDGFVFIFSGCRASAVTTSETYDRI